MASNASLGAALVGSSAGTRVFLSVCQPRPAMDGGKSALNALTVIEDLRLVFPNSPASFSFLICSMVKDDSPLTK